MEKIKLLHNVSYLFIMRIYSILFFTFISLQILGQKVVILGKSIEQESIFLSIQNELGENLTKELTYNLETLENNGIHLNINTPQLTYIIRTKKGEVNVYFFLVFPGDSIKVIHHSGLKYSITGKYQGEYMFFNDLDNLGIGLTNRPEKKCHYCVNNFSGWYRKRLSLLSKFADSLQFRKDFVIMAKRLIKRQYIANYLQPYFFEHQANNYDGIVNKAWQDSLVSLKSELFSNSDSLSIIYRHYNFFLNDIKAYNRFLVEPDYHKIPSFREQFLSAIKNFTGFHRDILLCNLMINGIKSGELDYKDYLIFKQVCTSPKYISMVDETIASYNQLKLSDIFMEISKSNKEFKMPISQNRLTYVDFWASWCKPCIIELPFVKNINDQYKRKGIDFIYVSIDEDLETWKEICEKYNISRDKNFILPLGLETEIFRIFNITSIPRYMIFGNDGNIINSDAPRPSDPKLTLIFDELLKK